MRDALPCYDHLHAPLLTARALLITQLGLLPPLQLTQQLAHATDAWLLSLWREIASPDLLQHASLFALGSYGRQELCLHSDLDVLVELHDPTLLEEPDTALMIERWMSACRQARVKLRHVVRTPDQGRAELLTDWRNPLALLDARRLTHTPPQPLPSTTQEAALHALRAHDSGLTSLAMLLAAHRARQPRQAQSLYLLEPDVKAGLGALRDLNTLHWSSLIRFELTPEHLHRPDLGWGPEQQQLYATARDWLFTLRQHLHARHERAHDRLQFPDQEAIAQLLFPHAPHPAEALMREHYHVTRALLQQLQRSLRWWSTPRDLHLATASTLDPPWLASRSELLILSAEVDPPSPCGLEHALDAIALADSLRLELDAPLAQLIARTVERFNVSDGKIVPDALHERLRDLLTRSAAAPATSTLLLELGLLPALLPEFVPLICHVQHDLYHVYTTDVHSLKCLERARALLHAPHDDAVCARWPHFARIAAQITRPELLLLAALIHDIGKNRGGDHARRGAALIPAIAARWRLDAERSAELTLLVREHLILSDTSRRRDLSDPRVIRDVAARLKTQDTLHLLTALTFCDMSTVGPDVMNDWRASLLLQLHLATRAYLERGAEQTWYNQRETIAARHIQLLARFSESPHTLPHDLTSREELSDRLSELLRDLPEEHVALATLDTLSSQLLLAHEHLRDTRRTAIACAPMPASPHVTEVLVATRDTPGALSKIAGVLSSCGVNILTAEIISTASGVAIDLFRVEATRHTPLSTTPQAPLSPERVARLVELLLQALDGELDVERLLRQRIEQTQLPARAEPEVPVEVHAYQDVSDAFTVLEVRAPDRMGLLYEIAATLHAQKVDTRSSKLDKLGNQVIDTFYVEDARHGKLTEEHLARVTHALKNALAHSTL